MLLVERMVLGTRTLTVKNVYLCQGCLNSVFHFTICIFGNAIEFEILRECKCTINKGLALVTIISKDAFDQNIVIIDCKAWIFRVKFLEPILIWYYDRVLSGECAAEKAPTNLKIARI